MKPLKYAILGLPLIAAAACTSTPPVPNEQLAVAKSALGNAEDAGAREHAALELRRARQKLDGAEAARQAENYQEALYLAEQAEIDARYAAFHARSERASDAVEELERGIAQLRAEVARSLEDLNRGGLQ